jgi:hypothetical protein
MKQSLFVVLAYVLLATAFITLEFQLRYTQMEGQATADETKTLFYVFSYSRNHARPPTQTILEPKTNK